MFILPFDRPNFSGAGRPRRDRLVEAMACALQWSPDDVRAVPRADRAIGAEGYREGPEAWEAMVAAGLVPATWLGSEQRVFPVACPACGAPDLEPCKRPCVKRDGGSSDTWETQPWPPRRLSAVPTSPGLVVALAADVSGVAMAEELALEFARRLQPWRSPATAPPTRVGWVLRARAGRPIERRACAPLRAVERLLGSALDAGNSDPVWRAIQRWKPQGWIERYAMEDEVFRLIWEFVERRSGSKSRLPDLRSFQNPFEPLSALSGTGYVFLGIRDATVVLVAPSEFR